jgi:general secretion pathway protein G
MLATPGASKTRAIRKWTCRLPQRGMTLLELMLAGLICALLLAMTTAGYRQVMERMRVATAIADIGQMQLAINKFQANRGAYPASLANVGFALLDPWGNPYRYLDFTGLVGKGSVRKDRNLVPINSDYDRYSVGPDSDTRLPLTAPQSRDDIVRANDGHFIGKAEDY